MKVKLEIKIEDGEAWWGGASMHGPSMPLTKTSEYRLDNTVNGTYNQVNGLFVSTQGRYIHVDGDFVLEVKDGVISVNADEDKIEWKKGFSNLKGAYHAAYKKYCTRKSSVHKDLLLKPQYCTWMECLKEPSQEGIINYAQSILDAGLPAGLLIIDDGWCYDYGDWHFVKERFPNPREMIKNLHELGFEVSIWICPFVNESTADFAKLKEKNALVRSANGEVAIREWWNGHSAVLDLTSPDAVEYFKDVLEELTSLGADGFKFDAGDAFYYEHTDVTYAPTTPNGQSYLYAKLASEYEISELRACVGMGGEPVIQRLSDKKSDWEGDGLSALVPDMLQASMSGYTYCCADMIGGGQGNPNNRIKYEEQEEFLLRSIQCVAMMPCMQFSYALWRGESSQAVRNEVKRSVNLHSSLQKYLQQTIKKCKKSGEPIMRPLEYDFPHQGYEEVKDCFMLGEKYLVAPVTKPGQRTITLRLPSGYNWKYANGKIYEGGETVVVPADIKTLPHFERINIVKKKKKVDWGKTIFLWVILAVPISNFLVFWLWVNFRSILMAFEYSEGGIVTWDWGKGNFELLKTDLSLDGRIFSAFGNTMLFFLANLLITLPISLLLCYFLFKKIHGYKFFRFVFYLPSLLPATALVMTFKYVINRQGLYGEVMDLMGNTVMNLEKLKGIGKGFEFLFRNVNFEKKTLLDPNTAIWTILFYQIMFSFGGNIILLSGAMNHIDGSILEAAKLDGCDMFTEIFRIVIPLIWPTLSTLIVFAFVGMLGSSGPILLFFEDISQTESYHVNTLSFWIYKSVYRTGEYYYASFVGLIMTAIGLPISLGIRKLLGKTMDTVEM